MLRRHATILIRALCLVGALAATPGCSDGGTPDDGSSSGGSAGLTGDVSCATDARVDAYAPGMVKQGEQGELSFELVGSEPGPPRKGSNEVRLRVTDSGGAPVSLALSVDLQMPDHGHGSSVVPSISFDPDTQVFTIAPLYLFMPGVWRIDFAVSGPDDAAPLDRASFFFCIEG